LFRFSESRQVDGLAPRSLPLRCSFLLTPSAIHPSPFILDLPLSKSAFHCVSFVAYWITTNRGVSVKQGYRLIIVDKAGVLVSEFQLTENALAQPEAFVAALKQSIDDIEEEEEP
jgi:hypothetical protein